MWGRKKNSTRRETHMRAYNDLRLIVCKRGSHSIKTWPITVVDWPMWEERGWTILAIDPEDEIAYVYALERGHMPLPSMT
jgi:hypothetical protein